MPVQKEDAERRLAFRVAGLGRPPEPPRRGLVVARQPLAREVELAELGLRRRQPLIGGATEPFGRLGRIARHAGAVEIEDRDVELGRGMPLPGRRLEPSRRVGQPLRHAFAAGMQRADRELCLGIAGFGGRPIPRRCLGLVERGTLAQAVHPGEVDHRRRVALARGLPEMGFRHDQVLRRALAAQQVQCQIVAGPRVVAFGRLPKQQDRPRRIAFDAGAGGAHQAERGLGVRMPLGRGFFVPAGSGRQIDLDPEAVGGKHAEPEFGGRLALLGGL